MSYEPTNWASGEIITADKLNKLEQGVAMSLQGILIPFKYYDVTGVGGFLKSDSVPDNPQFYTLEEVIELYTQSKGMLFAYDRDEVRGASPTLIRCGATGDRTFFQWDMTAIYSPESAEETSIYFTTVKCSLNSDGYIVGKHSWYTSITNDD